MTESDKKLIAFMGLLNAAIDQIKIYLNDPDPEMQSIMYQWPRIISNSVFDNTSSNYYCVEKIFHKEGPSIKRDRYKKLLIDLLVERKEIKKEIKRIQCKKLKGSLNHLIPDLMFRLKFAEKSIEDMKNRIKDLGKIEFLTEHCIGREIAATYILEYMLQENIILDLNNIKDILRRFAFTIKLEKLQGMKDGKLYNIHTQTNMNLEKIQKGKTVWMDYISIISEEGYFPLSDSSRLSFENANLELKYFIKKDK